MSAAVIEKASFAGVGIFSAFAMEFFGMPLQPIVWALIGGFLGMAFAKKQGFVGAAAAYIAASFISALLGHWAATKLDATNLTGNAFAALMSVGFHPAMAAFIAKVPEITTKGLAALGSLFPSKGQP